MAKLDKVKGEIGWIKAIFGIGLVTDISLVAWLVKNFGSSLSARFLIGFVVMVMLTIALVLVNRFAYKRINALEDLWQKF